MQILVIGGTRYFGIHMVNKLLEQGHDVTIATRGMTQDSYGDKVERIILQRTNRDSVNEALSGKHFDVVIDKIAYCSNDIKYVMDVVDCDKYIYMSSTSVYDPKTIDVKEDDFDAIAKELIWCDRKAFPYEEIKRQAECALWQAYPDKNWIAVRYPFAIGKDDYTKRLLFYVEHVMNEQPMFIDNIDYQMGYIRSDEAGEFLAYLVDKDVKGAINGSAKGTISLREIINYVEAKTGKKAVLSEDGEPAPYNGEPEYSINTAKAESLGYQFSVLEDWIYQLLDYYIERVCLKIRAAFQSDCDGIGKVYCESWKSAYQNLLPQTYLDLLTAENCSPNKVSENDIVLAKQERVLGICHFSEARNRDNKVWGEVVAIYLLPEIWGNGAGSELLQYSLGKLKKNGFKNICLWVLKDNIRARKFYEKNGFQISGNEREIEIAGCRVNEVEYIYYG